MAYLTEATQRIEALANEAATVGDEARVELCRRALDGDVDALRACLRALRDAEAQVEPAPITQPMTVGRWGRV